MKRLIESAMLWLALAGSGWAANITVATVADLATARPGDGDVVTTLGYSVAGTGANTYRYDADSAATANGGTVIAGPGSVGRYIAIDQTRIDVTQFGAVIDGVADDTAEIQAAIAAAHAGSIKTVYFPAGTCRTTGHLFLYGDVSLTGNGDESVIVIDGDIDTPSDGYWISCGIQSIGGTRTTWTGSITYLKFGASTNCNGMRACIFLHNATDWAVEYCNFDWTTAPEAVQDDLRYSVEGGNNNAWNLLDGNPRPRGRVCFNRITISQGADGCEGVGMNFGEDLHIIGNYIYGTGDDVIGLHGCKRCVVTKNICHTIDGRIVLNNCSEIICSENYITRCADKDGVWHGSGAMILADIEFGTDNEVPHHLTITDNILQIPSTITSAMYGIRMLGVRDCIIDGNQIINDSPYTVTGIGLEKGDPPADWTGPTGDVDYDATPPGTAKVRNVTITNNLCIGRYPCWIQTGGSETDFPGSFIVENNQAFGYVWIPWNSRFANNRTTIGNGTGFKYVGVLEDMPTLAEFSFTGLDSSHVTGSRLPAKVGGVTAKYTPYLKTTGRVMGLSVQSDTAIVGGGSVFVALYRNGTQVGSDMSVGTSMMYWTDFYNTNNFSFDNNVLNATTDEDYWEVKLYTSGTVSSTHDGIVKVFCLHDTANKDNISYNFAHTDVDTGADTITIGSHGLAVGDRVVLRSAGTILSATTALTLEPDTGCIYFVQAITGTTITLATTSGGALLDLTAQGSGTHTVTKLP